jgi:hypothetical protein
MKKILKSFKAASIGILILLIGISVACAAVMSCREPPSPEPIDCPLHFKEDGTFTILQFSDFHDFAFDENTCTMRNSLKTGLREYIGSAIDEVGPDFVVLTGDNIFCVSWLDSFLGISVRTIRLIADIFEEKKVFWTFTFGNHDTEGGTSKQAFIEGVQDYRYFIGGMHDGKWYHSLSFSAGNDDYRAGNYCIPVYDKTGQKAACAIFLLDSGAYPYVPHDVPYRYILEEQTEWYASEAAALKAANGSIPVPSVMFMHIPLIEHREAYLQGNTSIGVWTGISPSDTRSSIFSRAMETGDVRAIFAGHNHNNSYTGFYVSGNKKIMLGITPQATGGSPSNGLSSSAADAPVMYSRVITLSDNGNLSTRIHTSDKENHPGGIFRGESLSYTDL